jgi:hypothetical protein
MATLAPARTCAPAPARRVSRARRATRAAASRSDDANGTRAVNAPSRRDALLAAAAMAAMAPIDPSRAAQTQTTIDTLPTCQNERSHRPRSSRRASALDHRGGFLRHCGGCRVCRARGGGRVRRRQPDRRGAVSGARGGRPGPGLPTHADRRGGVRRGRRDERRHAVVPGVHRDSRVCHSGFDDAGDVSSRAALRTKRCFPSSRLAESGTTICPETKSGS